MNVYTYVMVTKFKLTLNLLFFTKCVTILIYNETIEIIDLKCVIKINICDNKNPSTSTATLNPILTSIHIKRN